MAAGSGELAVIETLDFVGPVWILRLLPTSATDSGRKLETGPQRQNKPLPMSGTAFGGKHERTTADAD